MGYGGIEGNLGFGHQYDYFHEVERGAWEVPMAGSRRLRVSKGGVARERGAAAERAKGCTAGLT